MEPTDPADTAGPKLADFLCFAILEELGLTYTQYIAIVALWEEGDQTVSGLGEKQLLEPNTVTPTLKKLEACP
jgi:MarR family transcriptional regulator, organic hydroperoxide resistance regulator